MEKHLPRYRLNNTTDRKKVFQEVDNVYESCGFSFLILDSATFPAFKIFGGGYQEKIWTFKKLRKLE